MKEEESKDIKHLLPAGRTLTIYLWRYTYVIGNTYYFVVYMVYVVYRQKMYLINIFTVIILTNLSDHYQYISFWLIFQKDQSNTTLTSLEPKSLDNKPFLLNFSGRPEVSNHQMSPVHFDTRVYLLPNSKAAILDTLY